MKIKPLMTEKSLRRGKAGKYTFLVPLSFGAGQVKKAIEDLFTLPVSKVWFLKKAGEKSFSRRSGRRALKPAKKMAVVSLKSGRLDIFETPEKVRKEKKKNG